MKSILTLLFCFPIIAWAQFAPQAGLLGSTAIHKDSNVIKAWAIACTYSPGWLNISDLSLGVITGGISNNALGYPDGNLLSLGDAGEAVYFFENPIVNGPGYDFAIFENGFRNPLDSNQSYSELAFVEVSNDGINYVRFPATCNNDTLLQIAGAGDYMDARKINNLAGKYITDYGTPFDLLDVAFSSSVQIDNIRYVRIKDVVGTILKPFCGIDQNNHAINDPFPTPFNTGGFDLDALGIIHQKFPTSISSIAEENVIKIYPNPASDFLSIKTDKKIKQLIITDLSGKKIDTLLYSHSNIDIHSLKEGSYILQVLFENNTSCYKLFQKW